MHFHERGGLVEVVAPKGVGDDLDGAQPELQAAVDVAPDLAGGLAQRIHRAVGENTVAPPSTQHLRQRLTPGLAANVPERDIDRADGVDDRAAAAMVAGRVVHAVPESLYVARILADQDLAQAHCMGMRARRLDDRPDDRWDAVHFGEARYALVGVHENHAVVVGAVEGHASPARHPQLDDLDVGDLHVRPRRFARNLPPAPHAAT